MGHSTTQQVRSGKQKEAEAYVRRCGGGVKLRKRGGGVHGDDAEDKKLIGRMIEEHEEKKPRRRKRGGAVPGGHPVGRLDRRARGGHEGVTAENVYHTRPGTARTEVTHPKMPTRAAGGRVGHSGKGKVNVIVHAGGGDDQGKLMQAKQEGAKMGAMAVLQKLKGAGAPPMGPPPGGGAPPMGPPPGMGMPPGGAPPGMPMRKRGGGVKKRADGGEVSRDEPGCGGVGRFTDIGAGSGGGGGPAGVDTLRDKLRDAKGGFDTPIGMGGGDRNRGGAVKVEKPDTVAKAERNRKETGHSEYVKVGAHRRRRAGGAV